MRKIRLLHLTDLHFGSAHKTGVDVKPGGAFLKDSFKYSPVESIYNALSALNPLPDLILFSGDYVTGKDSPKDYGPCKDLLSHLAVNRDKFLSKWSIAAEFSDRILLVPGNHDVERGRGDFLEQFRSAFQDYLTHLTLRTPASPFRKFAPLFVYENLKLAIYCLSTVDVATKADSEISDIIKNLTSLQLKKHEDLEGRDKMISSLQKREFPDAFGITSDTSSLFERLNREFQEAETNHSSYLKLLLCHHPFFPQTEVEIKPFASMIAGYNFLSLAGSYGYSVILHGHSHDANVIVQKAVRSHQTDVLHIGSTSAGSGGPSNGITVVDMSRGDHAASEVVISYKKFDKTRRMFDPDFIAGPFLLEDKKSAGIKPAAESSISGVILDKELRQIVAENKIIINGDIDRIQPAKYDCRLGNKYKQGEQVIELSVTDTGEVPKISIAPGETIIVCTTEEFNIPKDMVGHVTVLARWMKEDVIAKVSTIVDPGFAGQFYFPLSNISIKPVDIEVNRPIISLELVRLTHEVERGWLELKGTPRKDF